MNEEFILILVGILGLVVGFAIGLAVGVLRASPGAAQKSPEPVSPPETRPVEPPPAPPAPATSPPVEPVPPTQKQTAEPESGSKRPSMSPINVIARAIQSDVRSAQSADRSIAVQVDEILQEMLKSSPLAGRAIRLMELPQKGMVVMIGLDQYDAVDSVPDEDIRQILRAAVAEWEQRVSGQEN